MSEEKKHRNWWLRAILGGALALFLPVVVLISCRRTWIRPLAGVRVEMTRRAVQESHLGPESAYRLLLQAIEEPTGTASPRVWSVGRMKALAKLRLHGWPAAPPVRAAIRKPNQGADRPGSTPPEPVADPASPWSREQCDDIRELLTLYGPNVTLLDRVLAAPNPQMPTIDGTSGPQHDKQGTWWLGRVRRRRWNPAAVTTATEHGDMYRVPARPPGAARVEAGKPRMVAVGAIMRKMLVTMRAMTVAETDYQDEPMPERRESVA